MGLQGKGSTSFFSYVKTLSIGSARGLACFRLFHRLLVVLVADTVECLEKKSGGERKRGRNEKGLTPCCFFSFSLSFSPSPLSERLEQGAQDQTIELTALLTNDLLTEISSLE